jgi:serine/threonine-protein kinase
VPDVVGLSQREAGAKLKNTGFAVAVKERTVPGVLLGTVTEQSPAGGTKAAPGSTVTIVVAIAPEEVTVPALRGRSIEEARKLLSSLGLGISEKESVTPNLECGASQVTEHSPGPDRVVAVGTVVTVAYLSGSCRIG